MRFATVGLYTFTATSRIPLCLSPRDGECLPRGEAGTAWQRLRRGLEHWDRGEGSKSPRAAPFHCSPRRTVEEMSGRSPGGHGRGGVLEHSTRVTFPFLICFLPPSLHTHTRERRVGESSSRVLQRNIISAWHPSWGRDAPTLAQLVAGGSSERSVVARRRSLPARRGRPLRWG